MTDSRGRYAVSEVAEMFGVSRWTLTRWLDRLHLPIERTPGGHRRLSAHTVDTLRAAEQVLREQPGIPWQSTDRKGAAQ